jgi:GPH family glycoside/pentoside/hexuronide:cation symporter
MMKGHGQSPLSRWQMAAYASPSLPLALVVFPVYVILPGFYATNTPLDLVTIGTLLMVARAFDALVDPAIGYLSDAGDTRWGRRKPWLVAGTLIMCVATPLLYVPGPDTSPMAYLLTLLLFYLGVSLIETPHKAWGTELSSDYRTRSLISTSLAVAFAVGTLTFALIPFLISSSGVYSAEVLERVAWVLVIVLPLCTASALWRAPSAPAGRAPPMTPWSVLVSVARNRPLCWFLALFALTGLGQGVFYGLVFLLLTSVMSFGQSFAEFLLVDAVVTLVSLPLWYLAITRWSKHAAWALGSAIQVVAFGILLLMPITGSDKDLALTAIALRAFGGAVIYVAPGALLGDIVDYEMLRSGSNRAANFHALVSLLTKGTSTIGSGAGLLFVGWLGFDPKMPSAVGASAFKMVSLALPAVLLSAAAVMACRFPLDRRRHSTVVRALARRAGNARTA